MDTPDKNRISAVSFCNFQDSPVFQYINGLSPIEPVKAEHADHVFHSLALASPSSSLFTSPQIESYRDSRFLIKRHHSLDMSSPVAVLGEETVKSRQDVLVELKCNGPEEMIANVSETKPFKDQVKLAIDLATSLRNGCDNQMDEVVVPMDAENEIASVGMITQSAKDEDKEETGQQFSRKQRSVRRRCLTFDVGGSYKRIPLRDSTNDLPLESSTSINEAPTSPQKCVDSSKQESDEILLPVPRTIGLHLNALVIPSDSSDRNKFTCKDGYVLSPHAEDEFTTPVSTIRDVVSCDNNIMEEASERSKEGEWVEELGSCKRCRCKKSKCLKLYCDCFAAGLYCIEPCSCQNCFNRPIHEDVVMKTRRNVEARNPLAFAPKVVLTSASATYFGEESNKTPASARHMRGCNCKKSGCLKKYCECYLMGVGCSASCRCIGCKNVICQSNEQFQFPCALEPDAVTINEESKDHCDYIQV